MQLSLDLIDWNLWRRYHGIPELFDVMTKTVRIGGYPLRPEFIESTYFLYRVRIILASCIHPLTFTPGHARHLLP